jgi:flagellin
MSGITLTSSETSTILSLQATTTLFNSTSEDLNTGKKVNSASDNALAFFQSQSLYQRASAFSLRKSSIDQSVQTVNVALNATSAIGSLLSEIQGQISAAGGQTIEQRAAATKSVQNLASQIVNIVKDAQYQGTNLLESTAITLRTQFSERTASALVITGFDLISTQAGNVSGLFTGTSIFTNSNSNPFNFQNLLTSQIGTTGAFGGFSAVFTSTAGGEAAITNAENIIAQAIQQNNALTAELGTNVAILKTRSTFSSSYSATLSGGGDKLTLADLNAEAADSQALELRQNIGIQDLSVENTVAQSVLNLLK